MSRTPLRAALVIAGMTAVTWLASCAAILGLDETLDTSVDASAGLDGRGGGPDDGGSRDATTDGSGMRAPGEDGSMEDGGEGGVVLPSSYWELDKKFGDGGYLPLDTSAVQANARLGALEMFALSGNPYVVGMAVAGASDQLLVFPVTATDAGATLSKTFPGETGCRLIGAFATDADSGLAVSQCPSGEVYFANYAGSAPPDPGNEAGARISRLVSTPRASFVGAAGVDGGGSGVVTIAFQSVAFIRASYPTAVTLLAETPDGIWVGGFAYSFTQPTPVLLHLQGTQSSATIRPYVDDEACAVTDFVETDAGTFAVGYSGGRFALWPANDDAGGPRCIDAGAKVTAPPPSQSAVSPSSVVRAVVTGEQTIVASGSFTNPCLATFDENGAPANVLSPGEAGLTSLLDLTSTLPQLEGDSRWYPGGLLVIGDLLYATFSSGSSEPADAQPGVQWVVVRLLRVKAP